VLSKAKGCDTSLVGVLPDFSELFLRNLSVALLKSLEDEDLDEDLRNIIPTRPSDFMLGVLVIAKWINGNKI